jgi:large repetitive protein
MDDLAVTAVFALGEAPVITSAGHTAFEVGVPAAFTVTTTGVPTPTLTHSGTLPSGITFTDNGDGTATLSGTPPVAAAGIYRLTFTAGNTIPSDASQPFTLTVQQAPAITSADHTTFGLGVAGAFTVTTSGVPTPGIDLSGDLPEGVTFTDNGDGTATLSGTPATGSGGVYVLTLTASNGVSPNASQAFTLTVTGAPRITSADSTTFAVGVTEAFLVTATGIPTPALTYNGALPGGVTFTDHGDGTATVGGTPNRGTAGIYLLTITASNGVAPDATQAFTLIVEARVYLPLVVGR